MAKANDISAESSGDNSPIFGQSGNQNTINSNSFNDQRQYYYGDESNIIKIATLVDPDKSVIENRKYEGKEIHGPAVLLFHGKTTLERCNFEGDYKSFF
ncbi:MAG TPA: hypothetical protein VMR98_04750, partial [Candidatus Polarisedimenticolaceae bacterium]|nr:hypothetical protein [Candidatus Polarisedimenticolaceae bacterium]